MRQHLMGSSKQPQPCVWESKGRANLRGSFQVQNPGRKDMKEAGKPEGYGNGMQRGNRERPIAMGQQQPGEAAMLTSEEERLPRA